MAKQIKVREDNYFAVQGWMVTELKLKGNALMLYAIIYGFSQTTNTAFTGSVDYLCEWLGGVSRPTVINTLDNLVKQGLLTKSSTTKGALIYNSYTALRPSKKILSDEDSTSKNFLLNKDSKDNIEKSISKEMEGKASKKKSYSTILEDPVNKFVKEALSKFIQYCRGKNYTPKVTTVEKFASKEELHKLKRELDEFMAVNLKQVLKHNWQVFPTKVRGVDFVGYRFFGEYTLLRKSTCKTFKRRMLSISSKRENNVSPTYSEWCSFNSYVGWLQHCDSFRLYQKYVEPNVEYMHNYYLKEVKGNAEICKRKNYSGERKAS